NQMAAVGRPMDILVEVPHQDGITRVYRAMPGGQLASPRPDGGFAAARTMLPPELVREAHRHHIDLRQVYFATPEGMSFANAVRAAIVAQQLAAQQPGQLGTPQMGQAPDQGATPDTA